MKYRELRSVNFSQVSPLPHTKKVRRNWWQGCRHRHALGEIWRHYLGKALTSTWDYIQADHPTARSPFNITPFLLPMHTLSLSVTIIIDPVLIFSRSHQLQRLLTDISDSMVELEFEKATHNGIASEAQVQDDSVSMLGRESLLFIANTNVCHLQ